MIRTERALAVVLILVAVILVLIPFSLGLISNPGELLTQIVSGAFVIIFASAVALWWRAGRPPRPAAEVAQDLIRKSTGALGDFKMPKCIQIIADENLKNQVTDEVLGMILVRYKEHTKFWNGSYAAVTGELSSLARVLGKNPKKVLDRFNSI